jgi:RNA polymerase sigma factor (sigma-70 family)
MSRPRSNEELVEEIRKGVNVDENKVQLYRQNSGLIHKYVLKFARYDENFDDWESEAYFAVEKAIAEYDPEKGSFSTCLRWQLMGVLYTYKRKTNPLPAWMLDSMIKCNKAQAEIEKEKGIATPEEIAKRAGISLKQLETVMVAKRFLFPVSTSTPLTEDEEITLEDSIEDEHRFEDDVIEHIYEDEVKKELWAVVSEVLSEREFYIIEQMYKEKKTGTEIARQEGKFSQDIYAVRARAIKKLQYNSDLLKPFAKDL